VLIAVMAYGSNSALGAPAGRPMASPFTAHEGQLTAETVLQDALADALGDQAERVERRTVPGPASVLPGTTSQYVLRKAPCPVLIVPGTGHRD
jgi:hypothetical protein